MQEVISDKEAIKHMDLGSVNLSELLHNVITH